MEDDSIITPMLPEPATPTTGLSEAILASTGSQAIDRLNKASEEFRASESAHRSTVHDLERATRKLEAELASAEMFFVAGYRAPEYRLPFIRSERLPDFERRLAALRVLCRERELENARAELQKLSKTAAQEELPSEPKGETGQGDAGPEAEAGVEALNDTLRTLTATLEEQGGKLIAGMEAELEKLLSENRELQAEHDALVRARQEKGGEG